MAEFRKQTTALLTQAAQSYWLKRGFSCFTEIGLVSWGKLRADFVALSLKSDIVIGEIKSSVADYKSDTKWRNYLSYCNNLFFIMLPSVFDSLHDRMRDEGVFELGVGVLILDPHTGYLKCIRYSKRRSMTGKEKKAMITRLAWRNGISKRNSRRKRVYVEQEEDRQVSDRRVPRRTFRSARKRYSKAKAKTVI